MDFNTFFVFMALIGGPALCIVAILIGGPALCIVAILIGGKEDK